MGSRILTALTIGIAVVTCGCGSEGAARVGPTSLASSPPAPTALMAAATGSKIQVFVEPGAHTAPVVSLIRSAKHSLRLEVYLLTNPTIIDALAAAKNRGVDVRVLLEQHPYGATRYAGVGYDALKKAGVPVKWANESRFTYTHAKSLEVDGQTAGILTLNLSSSGLLHNREFGVIDHNAADARAIATIINADWARVAPKYSAPSLVVSPYNSRSDFNQIIASAHHTLDLYAEEVNDAGIENRLKAAVQRGVRVRLITSTGSPGVTTIKQDGVQVHLMPSPYIHAKAIVADGTRVFLGSENISSTSLDHNREIGILLGASAARVVEGTFASDWSGSHGGQGSGAEPTPPPPPPLPVPGKGGLPVSVSVSPHNSHEGDTLTIAGSTRPGATCTVRVAYPNGYVSRARALGVSETANSGGHVSWSFTEGSKSTGTGTASISCRLGPKQGAGSAKYTVS